mgnify:CR=1 FL=1
MQLTQKETSLLKDLKTQEKLCAEKYEKYSAEALDPQLKTLFSGIADTERHHLSMLEQIEGGSAPATAGGSHTQPGFRRLFRCRYRCKKARQLSLHRRSHNGKACFAPLRHLYF